MSSLAARVEQGIESRTLLHPGDRVLVAVSGGLDSMVLLRLLHRLALSSRWRLQLAVGHLDHQLRGSDSRSDARFVVWPWAESSILAGRCMYSIELVRPVKASAPDFQKFPDAMSRVRNPISPRRRARTSVHRRTRYPGELYVHRPCT